VLTLAEKQQEVSELQGKLERATSVFVVDYRGLDVFAVNVLRIRLRAGDPGQYEYKVVKNTLLRRAAEGSAVEAMAEHFQGPTAVAISYGDPVTLAKTLVDYAKDHEAFELRAGFLDGRLLDKSEIATLATLPGLEQLRATIAGLLQAPAQKIAAVLAAPGGQLARLVEARRVKLAESGDAA
jgi:large subunit ribosomal protein L10